MRAPAVFPLWDAGCRSNLGGRTGRLSHHTRAAQGKKPVRVYTTPTTSKLLSSKGMSWQSKWWSAHGLSKSAVT